MNTHCDRCGDPLTPQDTFFQAKICIPCWRVEHLGETRAEALANSRLGAARPRRH